MRSLRKLRKPLRRRQQSPKAAASHSRAYRGKCMSLTGTSMLRTMTPRATPRLMSKAIY